MDEEDVKPGRVIVVHHTDVHSGLHKHTGFRSGPWAILDVWDHESSWDDQPSRRIKVRHLEQKSFIHPERYYETEMFLSDCGIVPYHGGGWNQKNWTELLPMTVDLRQPAWQ